MAFLVAADVPPEALETMRLCLFDWAMCAIAGAGEPVAEIVRALVTADGGAPQSSVLGLREMRVPARAAAFANGAVSHALDYDDTHFAHIGHPSVVVVSAALALAERQGAHGGQLLEAAMLGAEVSVRLGQWLGEAHAARGFHTTATAGAFGAGAAAARLMGLSVAEMEHMFGILASRASGLSAQFGSMGKPLNAGFAASCGIEAADLAATGLQSNAVELGAPQGFGSAYDGAGDLTAFAALGTEWRMRDVSFKAHACCHGLHAMLNALSAVRLAHQEVDRVTVRTNPRWMNVCALPKPQTGLEAKFSFSLTAALALAGRNTGALETFSDAACYDPGLVALRDRVHVVPDPTLSATQAIVDISAAGGRAHRLTHDLAVPPPVSEQRRRLDAKAAALLGAPLAQALAAACFATEPDVSRLTEYLRQAGT